MTQPASEVKTLFSHTDDVSVLYDGDWTGNRAPEAVDGPISSYGDRKVEAAPEPGTTETGASEPGTTETGASEPDTSEPGASEADTSELGASEADTPEPVRTEPGMPESAEKFHEEPVAEPVSPMTSNIVGSETPSSGPSFQEMDMEDPTGLEDLREDIKEYKDGTHRFRRMNRYLEDEDGEPITQEESRQLDLWQQPFYRIRRKILAFEEYKIEDKSGKLLAHSSKKDQWSFKDVINVYTDQQQTDEIFYIQQTQMVDAWGTFQVIDSPTQQVVGTFKRNGLLSFIGTTEWEIFDAYGRLIGNIKQDVKDFMLERYIPIMNFMPQKLDLAFEGRRIARIKQGVKLMGDKWEVNCRDIPEHFDRRVLIASILLMGMVEKDLMDSRGRARTRHERRSGIRTISKLAGK